MDKLIHFVIGASIGALGVLEMKRWQLPGEEDLLPPLGDAGLPAPPPPPSLPHGGDEEGMQVGKCPSCAELFEIPPGTNTITCPSCDLSLRL